MSLLVGCYAPIPRQDQLSGHVEIDRLLEKTGQAFQLQLILLACRPKDREKRLSHTLDHGGCCLDLWLSLRRLGDEAEDNGADEHRNLPPRIDLGYQHHTSPMQRNPNRNRPNPNTQLSLNER